jgi:hypothetical protein
VADLKNLPIHKSSNIVLFKIKISALFMINDFHVPWKASALSERQKQSKD